jgi:hypothetical protein
MMMREDTMTVKNSVREVKTALAKLLATENLTVEFAHVQTASFDVKNRVLRLPIFKQEESDAEILDLFVGHEVAHALWTPCDELENLPIKTQNFHSFVNVTEDARIERLIQTKYPGLKKVFYNAYGRLNNADFFGIEKVEDVNSMLFIDRLNLKAKLGTQVDIEFVDEQELEFYNRSMQTTTFAEVVTLAEDIYHYCQEEMEEKQEEQDIDGVQQQGNADAESDTGDNVLPTKNKTDVDMSDDGTDTASKKDEESSSESDEVEDATEDEKATETSVDENDGDESEQETPEIIAGDENGPKSITDIAGEESLKNMIDDNMENVIGYLDIPKNIDIQKFIVPFKTVHEEILEYWNSDRRDTSLAENATKFKKKNQKVINYLHKEFEMKKAAQVQANSYESKTGAINTQKLYSYKFNEDIFKKATNAPAGKSHGMVFFLDWSGSMAPNLKGTMEQLINLALFCRKSNIPFTAYAFSSEYYKNAIPGSNQSRNLYEAVLGECALVELFGSKMNNSQFNKSVEIWLAVSNMFDRQSAGDFAYWGLPRKYYLSGTPLNEAIILATKVVPQFQRDTNVQIVNACFLTDGASHRLEGHFSIDPMNGREFIGDNYSRSNTLFVRDKKTNKTIEVRSEKYNRQDNRITKALFMMLKNITNCNLVGFFVCENKDFRYAYDCFLKDPEVIVTNFTQERDTFTEFKKAFMREKSVVAYHSGMDEMYILRGGKSLQIVDEQLDVPGSASKAQITTAFKKMTKGKLQNRVILTKFIDKIAA